MGDSVPFIKDDLDWGFSGMEKDYRYRMDDRHHCYHLSFL